MAKYWLWSPVWLSALLQPPWAGKPGECNTFFSETPNNKPEPDYHQHPWPAANPRLTQAHSCFQPDTSSSLLPADTSSSLLPACSFLISLPVPDLSVTPQYWFAPLPPMPTSEGRPFIGDEDFMQLFQQGAQWTASPVSSRFSSFTANGCLSRLRRTASASG